MPGLVLMGLVGAAAWGAEPCYGHSSANRLAGDHFVVEWADGVFDPGKAQVVLDSAEHARAVYTDEMGWPFTDEVVVVEILAGTGGGISGYAFTVDCGEIPVPKIQLTVGAWDPGNAEGVAAHEVGHAAQYGYMGDYLDSVASWLWFMEGTASWLEAHATGDAEDWGRTAGGFLAAPWVALHLGPTAFLVPERSNHMYGTAYLARYIEEEHGADAVRDLWEWGAPQTGTALYFPDAVEGVGLDFEPLWERFLAGMTVGDLEWGEHLGRRVSAVDVAALPAEGEPETGFYPEGLGITAVHFEAATGRPDRALQIAFHGDDEVDWIAVIVRTDGARIGGTVIDYVPLVVEDGEATGWLSGFDGSVDGWLLASPVSHDAGPFRLSWDAALVDDPGLMPGAIGFHGDLSPEPEGCSCTTPGAAPVAWSALVALAAVRRRSRPRIRA